LVQRENAMSADPPDLTEIISEIQRLEGGDLYMLLDPARNPDVLLKLDQLGLPMMPIFYREVSKELRPVVPYLTTCYADSPLVSWLAEHGWGQGWGTIMLSSAPASEMCRHLCPLMCVQLENGQKAIFRYWDPRVLREFLPACHEDQMLAVFGPINRFLLEGKEGEVLQFSLGGDD
jgi:hypothetical protein